MYVHVPHTRDAPTLLAMIWSLSVHWLLSVTECGHDILFIWCVVIIICAGVLSVLPSWKLVIFPQEGRVSGIERFQHTERECVC